MIFDYILFLFEDFMEFYGDCVFGDDVVIVGGIVIFYGILVIVIGY